MTHNVSQELRRTLGAFPTGVALVAAEIDGEKIGMMANSFTSVSLDPPLISIGFAHSSITWPQLSRAEHLGISILASTDRQNAEQLRRPNGERFAGIALRRSPTGALFLPDPAAAMLVEHHLHIDAGDHVLGLFRVVDHSRDADVAPLVFHSGQFGELANTSLTTERNIK